MKTQIPLSEAVGRTLTYQILGYNEDLLLVFGDHFCYVKASSYYEGTDLSEQDIDLRDFADHQLVEAGVCTQDEIDARRAREREATEASRAASERAMFEKLKAKYEP